MRLASATDIHLDHVGESARRRFCQSVPEQDNSLVVTDDIAESHILGSALESLATLTGRALFSCEVVGDVLPEASQSHPKCRILVLCGHTHGGDDGPVPRRGPQNRSQPLRPQSRLAALTSVGRRMLATRSQTQRGNEPDTAKTFGEPHQQLHRLRGRSWASLLAFRAQRALLDVLGAA